MTDRSDEKTNPHGIDRRRHPRHRFIQPLTIKKPTGEAHRATSFEISESGLSLATTVPLQVGEEVELTPVANATVRAVVKHNQLTMYGLQFIDLAPDLRNRLLELCKSCHYFRAWRTSDAAFFPETLDSITMWYGSINFTTSTSSLAASRVPGCFTAFSIADTVQNCVTASRARSCSDRILQMRPFSPTSPLVFQHVTELGCRW